jgi:UDP-N-acetylmuramate--alanine ligase
VEQGARMVAAFAEPGDLVLTVGAGDVDRAGPLVLEALR